MSKIKIIFFLILGFVFYRGYEAFTNFEIGVSDRIVELEEAADFERQGEVVALMMYLGDPPQLYEHLFVKHKSKCLEMKQIAEETSFAYYQCAVVDANLKGIEILRPMEVFGHDDAPHGHMHISFKNVKVHKSDLEKCIELESDRLRNLNLDLNLDTLRSLFKHQLRSKFKSKFRFKFRYII